MLTRCVLLIITFIEKCPIKKSEVRSCLRKHPYKILFLSNSMKRHCVNQGNRNQVFTCMKPGTGRRHAGLDVRRRGMLQRESTFNGGKATAALCRCMCAGGGEAGRHRQGATAFGASVHIALQKVDQFLA